MENKVEFVCPICGGNLHFWYEEINTYSRKISKNGKVQKKVTNRGLVDSSGLAFGLECIYCDWKVNGNNIAGYDKNSVESKLISVLIDTLYEEKN